MNYELAKRLKDAGFPEIVIQDNPAGTAPLSIETGPYRPSISMLPSLSTLIEACGENFVSLNRNEEFSTWEAYGKYQHWNNDIEYEGGQTPEEAVANLWLALNKKS